MSFRVVGVRETLARAAPKRSARAVTCFPFYLAFDVRQRLIVLLLYAILGWIFGMQAAAADSFELTFYDPILKDYIPGYSIRLMNDGSVIGYPRKLSSCSTSPTDTSACTTNMCRQSVIMRAWESCQAANAKEKRDSLASSPHPVNATDSSAPPSPSSAAGPSDPRTGKALECFRAAAEVLRDRLILLSAPNATSEEVAEELALNDEHLNALQRDGRRIFSIPCGAHISAADKFPLLPAPQLLRLFVFLNTYDDAVRSRLLAAARLAYEADMPRRAVPLAAWHECFVQLEYFRFVRHRAVDDISTHILDLCPAFENGAALRVAADQDLKGVVP